MITRRSVISIIGAVAMVAVLSWGAWAWVRDWRLTETSWQLAAIERTDGSPVWTPTKPQHFTVEWTADGRMRGAAGCNSYFVSRFHFNRLTHTMATQKVGKTMAGCSDPELNRWETPFHYAIARATRYSFEGTTLRLYYTIDDTGAAQVLVFRALP